MCRRAVAYHSYSGSMKRHQHLSQRPIYHGDRNAITLNWPLMHYLAYLYKYMCVKCYLRAVYFLNTSVQQLVANKLAGSFSTE